MGSIIPDLGAGAVSVNDPDVANAYIPPESFSISCEYVVLPSTCLARILPSQINAIVSEMIALMAVFDPDGEFDCTSVNNLATNFTVYADNVIEALDSLNERVTSLEGGGVQGIRSAYSTGVTGSQNIAQDSNARITSWLPPALTNVGYSAGVFTCLESGIWTITSMVATAVNTVREVVGVYKNGAIVGRNGSRSEVNRNHTADSVCWTGPLAVNDTIEIRYDVSAEGGGSINVNIGNFCMAKLGEI